jgi:hypothetical protein
MDVSRSVMMPREVTCKELERERGERIVSAGIVGESFGVGFLRRTYFEQYFPTREHCQKVVIVR